MVMLSQLLRYRLRDERGARASLVDLRVDPAAGDYPVVTEVLYRGTRRERRALPWDEVDADSGPKGTLRVRDLAAGAEAPPERLEQAVLLARDVLDSLVLDVANREATRANDLWLEQSDGKLALRAADLSPWAVIRRLGRGRLGVGRNKNLLDWAHVEFLRGDPRAARAGGDYHHRVADLQPAVIARLVDAISYVHAAELLTLIPDSAAADALEAMSEERQLQVFEELEEDQAVRLLALMAPDAAADLVGRLEPARVARSLEALPEPERQRLILLLSFPRDTAGGIMTNDVVAAPMTLTVVEARESMREQLSRPDFVYYVYVVDDVASDRLRGVLTLRDLTVARDEQRLEELMNPGLVTINPLEPAIGAARKVAEEHFAALPVVADDGQLLGAITVDAAMARLAPAGWRDQAPKVFS